MAHTVITKQSKFYPSRKIHGSVCHYWWDIAPPAKSKMDESQIIRFMKKDTGEYADLHAPYLKQFLTEERRTTRSSGNWRIVVIEDYPNHLAIDYGPEAPGKQLLLIPVVWHG